MEVRPWLADWELMSASIAKAIRARMARLGWERADVADRAGYSVVVFQKRLAGTRDWPLQGFVATAAALGLTASELMGQVEQIAAEDYTRRPRHSGRYGR
jgi:transcriptional regulator with XRE-family HTH domain